MGPDTTAPTVAPTIAAPPTADIPPCQQTQNTQTELIFLKKWSQMKSNDR